MTEAYEKAAVPETKGLVVSRIQYMHGSDYFQNNNWPKVEEEGKAG